MQQKASQRTRLVIRSASAVKRYRPGTPQLLNLVCRRLDQFLIGSQQLRHEGALEKALCSSSFPHLCPAQEQFLPPLPLLLSLIRHEGEPWNMLLNQHPACHWRCKYPLDGEFASLRDTFTERKNLLASLWEAQPPARQHVPQDAMGRCGRGLRRLFEGMRLLSIDRSLRPQWK